MQAYGIKWKTYLNIELKPLVQQFLFVYTNNGNNEAKRCPPKRYNPPSERRVTDV